VIFHVLTIFPEFFEGPFEHGVIKRARDTGALEIRIHNLRDWTATGTRPWTTGRSGAAKACC
jgi:tRNA (guanine-N1)-methyltransferase